MCANRSGKWTAQCPSCNEGYLNVEIKKDSVVWFCHHCDKGGGEPFDQPGTGKKVDELGPIKADVTTTPTRSGQRMFQVLRFEPVNAAKAISPAYQSRSEKTEIKGVRIVRSGCRS